MCCPRLSPDSCQSRSELGVFGQVNAVVVGDIDHAVIGGDDHRHVRSESCREAVEHLVDLFELFDPLVGVPAGLVSGFVEFAPVEVDEPAAGSAHFFVCVAHPLLPGVRAPEATPAQGCRVESAAAELRLAQLHDVKT